jgi:hypothetical protein
LATFLPQGIDNATGDAVTPFFEELHSTKKTCKGFGATAPKKHRMV